MTDDPCDWSTGQLASAIAHRALSSREALACFAGRIERLDPLLNAIVTRDIERAGAEAAAADEATARGERLGPLHGVPFTVKDAIATAGMRSTAAAKELEHHVPSEDAPAVARLRAAGGVLFGKSNLPTWSADFQTSNALFGTTNNPHDLARTPGGSSGGAAAAVAAGLTGFELGTDIGGSVRVPAHFCGVFGHKPSFGIVSQVGYLDHVGGGWNGADLNVFGPIARSAEDLELLLGVLAAPDSVLARAWRLDLPPPRHQGLAGYRIGTWLDDPACPVDAAVAGPLHAAVETLRHAGAQVSEDRPPCEFGEAAALFRTLIAAAMSPSLPPERAERAGGSHHGWLEAGRRQADLRAVWSDWFREHDVLLCPVAGVAAFPHDLDRPVRERTVPVNREPRSYLSVMEWCGLVGVGYLPSTVVPVGRTPGGLPVGIQVVAPFLEDRTGLYVAARLAELTGGFVPPPLTGTAQA